MTIKDGEGNDIPLSSVQPASGYPVRDANDNIIQAHIAP
jgi:hypothetical protein